MRRSTGRTDARGANSSKTGRFRERVLETVNDSQARGPGVREPGSWKPRTFAHGPRKNETFSLDLVQPWMIQSFPKSAQAWEWSTLDFPLAVTLTNGLQRQLLKMAWKDRCSQVAINIS